MSSQGHEELTIHPPKGDSRSLQRPAIFSYHGQTLFRDCRLTLSILPKQPIGPIRFCFQSIKFTFLYLIPVVSAGLFVHFQWQRRSFPCESTFPCACLRFRRINILRTHYHGFSILIGATHTPSSRLYAPPTAVRTNKNYGAFSSLFWTILSRSLLRLSAPSLIRSTPLTQGKI